MMLEGAVLIVSDHFGQGQQGALTVAAEPIY